MRLDHNADAELGHHPGGEPQVGDKGLQAARAIALGRSGQHVDGPRLQDLGVGGGMIECGAKISLAARHAGESLATGDEIARRHIEQHDRHLEPALDAEPGLGRDVVGELHLDRAEARAPRQPRPIEQGVLAKKHRDVCAEPWHRSPPPKEPIAFFASVELPAWRAVPRSAARGS